MDEFDIKLLKALQEDGRLTNNELAERIGLSASQCSRRRAALEESGVIESYHAVLSAEAVGLDVLVFIQVGLATQSPDSGQAFVKLIDGINHMGIVSVPKAVSIIAAYGEKIICIGKGLAELVTHAESIGIYAASIGIVIHLVASEALVEIRAGRDAFGNVSFISIETLPLVGISDPDIIGSVRGLISLRSAGLCSDLFRGEQGAPH